MKAGRLRVLMFVAVSGSVAAWAGCTSLVGDFGLGTPVGSPDAANVADVGHDAPAPVDASSDAPRAVDAGADAPVDAHTCGAHCAVQAATGNYHTCVLLGDGTVSCWGNDTYGMLGDNVYEADAGSPDPASDKPTPNVVNGLSGVTAISAGALHTCAIAAGGTVYCWGLDDVGQCGDGRARTSSTGAAPIVGQPTQVAGIANAVEIKSRGYATCARLQDGTITCWGMNGLATFESLGSPSPPAFTNCVPLNVGGGPYSCIPTPQVAQGGAHYDTFAVGEYHMCAVSSAGAKPLQCWGDDSFGELGVVLDGGATASTAPVDVPLPAAVSSLAGGFSHTCAALANGALYCWGQGNDGELGDGVATTSPTPQHTLLPPGTSLKALAAGLANTCGVLDDGTVVCAGSNYVGADGYAASDTCPSGLLGNVCSLTLKRVGGITAAANVVFGAFSACSVQVGGALLCWGDNSYGELGVGFDAGASTQTPLPVSL